MEKWEKNHVSRQFSKGGTGTKQSGTSTILVLSLFWTSVIILAISYSFLIRFELFKLLVKLDFKDNKTP